MTEVEIGDEDRLALQFYSEPLGEDYVDEYALLTTASHGLTFNKREAIDIVKALVDWLL